MLLKKTFKNTVINTWGNKGQTWLSKLPSCIEFLAQYWSLTEIQPVENMSFNFVALALQKKKKPVVLKISCDAALISDEYNALKHFNGIGAIKVLDIHTEHNALLLEQAVPGNLLNYQHPLQIEETINAYAKVINQLASLPLSNKNFTHVSKWCDAIDRIQDARIEQHFVDYAKALKIKLLKTAQFEYLCHGDLHLENIIKHGESWLAIDPKGIIGEMAFEAAAFDLIRKDEMLEVSNLSSKIVDRVSQLSTALLLDYDRLLSWIFLRVIISAQWFVEDNGDPTDMLLLATHIYPLLNRKEVCAAYDKISDWYQDHRSRDLFERPYLDKVMSLIKPGASILDLGCGTGEPIARYFLENGYHVTGIDGSIQQINKAKSSFPHANFMVADMRSLNLNKKFDCIIAWHSYFHLSKAEQRQMFAVIKNHLKANGILLFTSGVEDGEIWSDNGGEMLYHASLNPSEYQSLLTTHHFTIICQKIQDPECGYATVWLARYLSSEQLT